MKGFGGFGLFLGSGCAEMISTFVWKRMIFYHWEVWSATGFSFRGWCIFSFFFFFSLFKHLKKNGSCSFRKGLFIVGKDDDVSDSHSVTRNEVNFVTDEECPPIHCGDFLVFLLDCDGDKCSLPSLQPLLESVIFPSVPLWAPLPFCRFTTHTKFSRNAFFYQ